MLLFKHGMDLKGVKDVLQDFTVAAPNGELDHDWFLVCHGTEAFEEFLEKHGSVRSARGRALVTSTERMDVAVERECPELYASGIVRGLPWGLGAMGDENQARWKKALLRRFVEGVGKLSSWQDGEPPWNVLNPPSSPEKLLACFVLLSSSFDVPDEWRIAAEDEYAALNRSGNWPEFALTKEVLGAILKAAGGAAEL